MQEIMAELQQLGAMDPTAQEKLLADLKQTEPALWPLVVQQFRATVAYRRRSQQAPAGTGAEAGSSPKAVASSQPGLLPSPPPGAAPTVPQRLPPVAKTAIPPQTPPQGSYPQTPYPAIDARVLAATADPQQAKANAGQVVNVAYQSRAEEGWQAAVTEAIRQLEPQVQGMPKTEADYSRHVQLRMLYLLAGRRDDAFRPIAAAPPCVQDYWTKQLYALDKWLDAERTPDAMRRAAEAKQALVEAAARLGESAPLVVRNLAFCTQVESYGCAKAFGKSEFFPDQEVLLYAEIENFASEPTAKGFHTSLRSSYQIFDSRGQRVADHEFTTTEEHCQNLRRDFFIPYHLRMPKRIYPGKYTLQLTVEDLKSHKVGQSSIELTIKDDGK